MPFGRLVKSIAGGLALAAMLALPQGGAGIARPSAGLAAVYDVYFGGIWAGEFVVSADFGRDAYQAGFDFRTAGLAALFFDLAYSARTVGAVEPGGLAPAHFRFDIHDGDDKRVVEMGYSSGTPGILRADPPLKQRPWSIEASAQTGIADPLSAGLGVFGPAPPERLCDRGTQVFDGRHRYDIEIGPAEPGRGGRIRCEAALVRLAGYKPKTMHKRSRIQFSLEFSPRGDGLYQTARAAAETEYGTTVILLRE